MVCCENMSNPCLFYLFSRMQEIYFYFFLNLNNTLNFNGKSFNIF